MAGTDEPTADGLRNNELPGMRDLTEAVQARDSMIVALRESEGRYRELVENCGLMVVSYDPECRIRYMNARCMEHIGLKGPSFVGRHVTEVFGPEIGGRIVERMAKLLATGKTEPAMDRVMTPAGPRWFWAQPSVMRDDSGKVTGVTVFVQDITEQKLAEDKLQKSEEEFRHLVNYAGFIIVRCSLDGTVYFMNDMGLQYGDRRFTDAAGRHMSQMWGPVMAESFMGGIQRALEKGKDIERELEMPFRRGTRWFWARYNLMKDAEGRPESVIFFAHDITNQKLAEVQLKESEESLRELVKASGIMVARFDTEYRFAFINEVGQTILGLEPGDIIGKHVTDVLGEELGARFVSSIHRIIETGQSLETVAGAQLKGAQRWFWSHGGLIRDRAGAPAGVALFSRDVTEERMAQIKLAENEENYRQLVETAGLVMAIWDLEGRMQFVNGLGASFLRCKPEDVLGKHVTEVFGPVVGGSFLRDMQRIVEKGIDDEHVTEMPLPGGVRWFWSRGNLMRDSRGKTTGVAVFARDVTEERLARRKVEESEGKYRQFVEECGLIVLCFSPDGRVTFVNSQGVRFLDRAVEAIVGNTVEKVFGEEFGKVVRDRIAHIAATGSIEYYEDRLTTSRGMRWILGHPSIIRDANGRVSSVVAHIHDITEYRLAQEKVRESEERYQQLIETAGVSVTCFDNDLRVTLVNSISAARFGRRPDEVIGKRLSDIAGLASFKFMERELRKVLETKRVYEQEVELVLPVGRRWYWYRMNPLYGADGQVAGVMVFAHDISEQKMAQLALHESESRRRMLTDMAMEAIFMHEDGILLEANPRYFEMFGYTPEELLGKQARDITLTPESLRMAMENIRTGGHKRIQVVGVRKDGSQFPCEIYGMDAMYKGRKVRVAVTMDISDRVKAETELAQIREKMATTERLAAVGYIGATMAHEVNTPLSVMRLTLQMLIGELEKGGGRKTNLEQAGTILREIDRVSGIVRRYREMSRPSREIGDNADEIRAAPELVKRVFLEAAHNVKLHITIGDEVPELLTKLGNVNDAEQLMFVLVQNAVQAADSRKSETLNVTGCIRDKNVELRFADDCCGIPPENLTKIFEPFFSTKPRNIGTGLGLSIVRRLLQERGGSIKVESEPGRGTTFIVTYPAYTIRPK
jgi:PAS domain S-box-containing protein